jgi:hypothetical protein
MRKWIIALTIVALAWSAHEAYAQQRLRQLMLDKLQNAQKILEALAVGDYDKMVKHADNLQQLANEAEWVAYKTKRYETHSNEFRRAAETIVRRAKDKNLDGATLAYMDLTMSCVRCHQYVREVRDARLPAAPDATARAPVPAGGCP